jgi:hypothetical protein
MTMGRRHLRKEQGYSLLETVVSMIVFLLVLFAVYIVLESNQTIYAKGESRVDVQQSARASMDQIAALLRNAGYFPENFTTPAPPVPLTNPIQLATDNALAIYGDADGTGTSNVFLFCQNGTEVRWVKAAAGLLGAYSCAQGMVLARNVTRLTFSYFDANHSPIPNPPTPPYQLDGQGVNAIPSFAVTTQRGAIWRVVVALTATENVTGQQPQTFTLTSNLRLRNLN